MGRGKLTHREERQSVKIMGVYITYVHKTKKIVTHGKEENVTQLATSFAGTAERMKETREARAIARNLTGEPLMKAEKGENRKGEEIARQCMIVHLRDGDADPQEYVSGFEGYNNKEEPI